MPYGYDDEPDDTSMDQPDESLSPQRPETPYAPPPPPAPMPSLPAIPEPWTSTDDRRLLGLQAGLSDTQRQIDSGMLSPQEGAMLKQGILGRMVPLSQRQKQAKQQGIQEQMQQMQQQVAMGAAIDQQNAAYHAKGFGARIYEHLDPLTGKMITFFQRRPQEWDQAEFPPDQQAEAPSQGKQEDSQQSPENFFPGLALGIGAPQGDRNQQPSADNLAPVQAPSEAGGGEAPDDHAPGGALTSEAVQAKIDQQRAREQVQQATAQGQPVGLSTYAQSQGWKTTDQWVGDRQTVKGGQPVGSSMFSQGSLVPNDAELHELYRRANGAIPPPQLSGDPRANATAILHRNDKVDALMHNLIEKHMIQKQRQETARAASEESQRKEGVRGEQQKSHAQDQKDLLTMRNGLRSQGINAEWRLMPMKEKDAIVQNFRHEINTRMKGYQDEQRKYEAAHREWKGLKSDTRGPEPKAPSGMPDYMATDETRLAKAHELAQKHFELLNPHTAVNGVQDQQAAHDALPPEVRQQIPRPQSSLSADEKKTVQDYTTWHQSLSPEARQQFGLTPPEQTTPQQATTALAFKAKTEARVAEAKKKSGEEKAARLGELRRKSVQAPQLVTPEELQEMVDLEK